MVGLSIQDALEGVDFEAEVAQLIRDEQYVSNPLPSTTVQSGDVYTVQLTDDALQTLLEVDGVDLVPGVTAETDLETLAPEQTLVEIILTAGSDLIGEAIDSAGFWGVSSCFGRYEPAADRADSRQPAAWL